MLHLDYLRECLRYSKTTGELQWLLRPRSHFKATDRWLAWNKTWAGKRAGSPHNAGYRSVAITCNGKTFVILEHRVAWALATGAWPVGVIDHRDLDRSNNRFENLRDITFEQNCHSTTRPLGMSKLRGAYRCGNRWRAQIKAGKKLHYLGVFETAQLAHKAYLDAKSKLHIRS